MMPFYWRNEFDSGLPSELGNNRRVVRRVEAVDPASVDGGPVCFTPEAFHVAASELRFAAEIAMQRDHLAGDDPIILRFVRYAEMMEQAAGR